MLSGGGAKGLAHIGMLMALDSIGIRPSLIVGTSMGAVVGALYASGLSAREIDSLTRALPIAHAFESAPPRGSAAWGTLIPQLVWEEGPRGFAVQNMAVRASEVNSLLGTTLLRGNLIARGDFDRLPIRLRVVATNLRDRTVVVLHGGDLAQAVRASLSIPLVFPPEVVGEQTLTDGGLSANIPVAVARAAGARRILVSDVTERRPTPQPGIAVRGGRSLLNWLSGNRMIRCLRRPLRPIERGGVFGLSTSRPGLWTR